MDQSNIKEFSLHLISNADQVRHPDNVISAFTTTTNTPLQFQYGTWTCGLRSLSYPNRLVHIDNREQYGITFSREQLDSTEVEIKAKAVKLPTALEIGYIQGHEFTHTFPLRLNNISTVEKTARILNKNFENMEMVRYMKAQKVFEAYFTIDIRKIISGGRRRRKLRTLNIGCFLTFSNSVDSFFQNVNNFISSLFASLGDDVVVIFHNNGETVSLEVSNNCEVLLSMRCVNNHVEIERFFFEFFGLSSDVYIYVISTTPNESSLIERTNIGNRTTTPTRVRNGNNYIIDVFSNIGGNDTLTHYKSGYHPLYFEGVTEKFETICENLEDNTKTVKEYSLQELSAVTTMEELSSLLFHTDSSNFLNLEYEEETRRFKIVNNELYNVRVRIKNVCNILAPILGLIVDEFELSVNTPVAVLIFVVEAQSFYSCQRQPELGFFRANKMKLSEAVVAEGNRMNNSVRLQFTDEFSSDREGFMGIELSINFNFSPKIFTLYLFKPMEDYIERNRQRYSLYSDEEYSTYENSAFEEKDIQFFGRAYTVGFNLNTYTLFRNSFRNRQEFEDNFQIPTNNIIHDEQIQHLCKFENTAYCSIGSVFSRKSIFNIYLFKTLEALIEAPASFSNPKQMGDVVLDSFESFRVNTNDTTLLSIRDILDVSYEEILNKFYFKLKPVDSNNPLPTDVISHLVLYLPAKLSLLFGFGYKTTTIMLNRPIDINIKPDQNYLDRCTILNVRSIYGQFHNAIMSSVNIDLLTGVHNIMVHCNFISNNFVGNDTLNVLDIVPFISNENDYVTHEPRNILHKTVKQEELRDIRVEILDTERNRIRFAAGTSPIHLSLIFKRIK